MVTHKITAGYNRTKLVSHSMRLWQMMMELNFH